MAFKSRFSGRKTSTTSKRGPLKTRVNSSGYAQFKDPATGQWPVLNFVCEA